MSLAGITFGVGGWIGQTTQASARKVRSKVGLEVHKATRIKEMRTYTAIPKNADEAEAFVAERGALLQNPTANLRASGRVRSVAIAGWNTLNAAAHTPAPPEFAGLEVRAKELFERYPKMPGSHPNVATFAWGSEGQRVRLAAIVDAGLVPNVAPYHGPTVDDVRPMALVGMVGAALAFALLGIVAPFRMGFAAEVAGGESTERVEAAGAAAVVPVLWALPQLGIVALTASWTGHLMAGGAFALSAPLASALLCTVATALVVARRR